MIQIIHILKEFMVDFKCVMFVEGQQEDVVKIAVQSIIAIKRVKKLTGKNTTLNVQKTFRIVL